MISGVLNATQCYDKLLPDIFWKRKKNIESDFFMTLSLFSGVTNQNMIDSFHLFEKRDRHRNHKIQDVDLVLHQKS